MTKWAFASVALAFVSLACGSGSTGGNGGSSGSGGSGGTGGAGGKDGGGDGGSSVATACAAYAMAACTQLNACSKVVIQRDYGMMDACVTTETQSCTNALNAASTGDSPATRQACAAALSGWACSDFLNGQNPPSACNPKTGMVASGGACAFAAQCQSGFCAIEPKAACGTCATTPAVGDPCAKLTTCGTGLVCSTANVCEAPGATGASCGPDNPCLVGLSCVGASPKKKPPVMGTCQTAVGTSGGTCDPAQNTGPACDTSEDLVCNSTTKTCATLVFAAPGATCGNATGQLIDCSDGSNCSAMPGPGMSGTCTATIPDKQACMRVAGTGPCATGERCIVVGDSGTSGTCEFNGATACK